MCNCCPPTVNALFCLWARSGCSKASVAGALTFFPPDPPLYKFQRYTSDGELLPEETDIIDNSNIRSKNNNNDGEQKYYEDGEINTNESNDNDDLNGDAMNRMSGRKPGEESIKVQGPKSKTMDRGGGSNDNNVDEEDVDNPDGNRRNVHPAQALTDRALALRKRAKIVNQRDALDAKNGITYRFIPDPRLTRPPSFSGRIEAVKIGPHPRTKNFIAALIYRVRPDRVTERTKTIIYSHGNATDIGAMYFMQVVLAKGLQCNVIMYDYSGYGESGGVPLENNTYNDVEMVYDYAINNVVQNGDERQIIIYGQSVGSGPSCYICSKKPNVGGLILHSPFMSGMRVLTPSR